MRFLIIGLGSMGKRRVRNLLKQGERDIIGFDIREDRASEANKLYNITTFTKFEEAIVQKPNVFVISCPPDQHLFYAHYATDNDIHFFSEVNTDLSETLYDLIRKLVNKKIVAAPSCTMRYHPCAIAIKNIIESKSLGKPLLLTYHSGENLEDWHPWEKVTDYYVGSRKTGGGRDQIAFELEWIRWIMGEMIAVRALTTKLSNTPADIFDIYDLIIEFRSGAVSNVLVDVIQRPADRIFRLVCEMGVIHWDWMNHLVRVYNASEKKIEEIPEREGYKGYLVEEMYEEEMRYFIGAIRGQCRYPITFSDEAELLEAVYASEQSSATGQKVQLD